MNQMNCLNNFKIKKLEKYSNFIRKKIGESFKYVRKNKYKFL